MTPRDMSVRAPTTIILALATCIFAALGMRTYLQPEAAAAFFGSPTDSAAALVFVKAYGARNIAIALTALTLLWLDLRSALSALLVFAAGVAGLDALTMFAHAGFAGAAKHVAYVVGLGGLALLSFWPRLRVQAGADTKPQGP